MKTTKITSKPQATLLLFGAVVVAVIIFMADTGASAQSSQAAAPTSQAADLDQFAQNIQTNLSAADVAGQLANRRSQLPGFAEWSSERSLNEQADETLAGQCDIHLLHRYPLVAHRQGDHAQSLWHQHPHL